MCQQATDPLTGALDWRPNCLADKPRCAGKSCLPGGLSAGTVGAPSPDFADREVGKTHGIFTSLTDHAELTKLIFRLPIILSHSISRAGGTSNANLNVLLQLLLLRDPGPKLIP